MLKLLSATPSPYARKVRIALAEKGVPFELVTEVPWDSTTQTPKHNPLEKLPVLLLEDGSAVYESRFILEWIEAKLPGPSMLPDDLDDRLFARRVEVVVDGACEPWSPCSGNVTGRRSTRAPSGRCASCARWTAACVPWPSGLAPASTWSATDSGWPTSPPGRCVATSTCVSRIIPGGPGTRSCRPIATGWSSGPRSGAVCLCRRSSTTRWFERAGPVQGTVAGLGGQAAIRPAPDDRCRRHRLRGTQRCSSTRERYGVDLIGPTRGDRQWQAQAGAGFAARDFAIDFVQQQATCPAGKASQSWTPALARGTTPVIKIKFAVADCRACPLRPQCTRSTSARRAITIRPEAQHEALRAGRAREQTAEFAAEYARRAEVEGTRPELERIPFASERKRVKMLVGTMD